MHTSASREVRIAYLRETAVEGKKPPAWKAEAAATIERNTTLRLCTVKRGSPVNQYSLTGTAVRPAARRHSPRSCALRVYEATL